MNKIDRLLAEMCPDGVDFKTVEEIFNLRNGYTPAKSNEEFWSKGDVPWFRMEDIRENGKVLHSAIQNISSTAVKGGKLFPENSILVATSATIGEHALVTVPHLSNQRFTNLSLKEEFLGRYNIKFLYYYADILDEWCTKNTTKSSFSSVDMRKFKKFSFPLPPLEIQREIVNILDNFVKLEAELEARKKQYEFYREQLLSFAPRATHTDRQGWQLMPLGSLCTYSKNTVESTELDQTTFVGVDNLLAHKQGRRDATYFANTARLKSFSPGDVLIGNIRPYLRKIWLSDRNGGCSGDVLPLVRRTDSPPILPEFLYQALSSEDFFRYMTDTAKGAKMPRGDKNAILNFKVPVPPITRQEEIVGILSKFETLVNDLSSGLPAEIAARRQQYEYYRDQLLTFERKVA